MHRVSKLNYINGGLHSKVCMNENNQWRYILEIYFLLLNKDKIPLIMAPPIFLSKPPLVVGMPVFLAILFLKPEIPKARFHEKEKPNLPMIVPFKSSNRFLYLRYKN